jgi:hypothetical protein
VAIEKNCKSICFVLILDKTVVQIGASLSTTIPSGNHKLPKSPCFFCPNLLICCLPKFASSQLSNSEILLQVFVTWKLLPCVGEKCTISSNQYRLFVLIICQLFLACSLKKHSHILILISAVFLITLDLFFAHFDTF